MRPRSRTPAGHNCRAELATWQHHGTMDHAGQADHGTGAMGRRTRHYGTMVPVVPLEGGTTGYSGPWDMGRERTMDHGTGRSPREWHHRGRPRDEGPGRHWPKRTDPSMVTVTVIWLHLRPTDQESPSHQARTVVPGTEVRWPPRGWHQRDGAEVKATPSRMATSNNWSLLVWHPNQMLSGSLESSGQGACKEQIGYGLGPVSTAYECVNYRWSQSHIQSGPYNTTG